MVMIVDLDGLSFGHFTGSSGKRFLARMKMSNGIFSWYYPESTFKVIVMLKNLFVLWAAWA